MGAKTAKMLSASLEGHLEAVFWSVAAEGTARAKDIASQLKVRARLRYRCSTVAGGEKVYSLPAV